MPSARAREPYSVYCDESGHLLHDQVSAMTLGAVWCKRSRVPEITRRIKAIKQRHGIQPMADIKWTKISPSNLEMYHDLVDFFFDDDDLHFRSLVIKDKGQLRHDDFNQDHDTWYYKMFFYLLKNIISSHGRYHIFLDVKDTKSSMKETKLAEVLANQNYDFSRQIVERVQAIRSEESQITQLCDVLIGAVGSANRNSTSSEAKLAIVDQIKKRSRFALTVSTLPSEPKFNVFCWRPQLNEVD